MALLIKPTNVSIDECAVITPKNGTEFTALELHTYVDGYIEVAPHLNEPDLLMFVNDNFLSRDDLQFNPLASLLAQEEIYGNAVICTLKEAGE